MYGPANDWDTIRECHEKSMQKAMSEILSARETEKAAVSNRSGAARREKNLDRQSSVGPKLEMPKTYTAQLERGRPEIVERIRALLKDGLMRPSAIRKAIGITSSVHFNQYYISPMLAQGLIERTDPEHPQSPQQKYRLS